MKRREWFHKMAGLGLLLAAGTKSNSVFALAGEQSEKTKTITHDGLKMTWIQDNPNERRMSNSIFSGADSSEIEALSPEGGALSSMSCFLLQTDGKNILFDTANGNAESLLLSSLKSLGVEPDGIDYIFITHFHGDHIGGMMQENTPVFKRAEVYVPKAEYDGWMAMPEERKAQVVSTMSAYEERLHLFNYEDSLPCGIKAMDASGHTPGHTVYQVGNFLVIGDLIHGAAIQLKNPEICASFDMDIAKAVASRKKFLEYAKENKLTMAGMHLPAPAFLDL